MATQQNSDRLRVYTNTEYVFLVKVKLSNDTSYGVISDPVPRLVYGYEGSEDLWKRVIFSRQLEPLDSALVQPLLAAMLDRSTRRRLIEVLQNADLGWVEEHL